MRWIPLFLLFGCPGPGPDTGETDPDTDSDTDNPFGGEDGSLTLLRSYENGELINAEVVGLFMNDDQGFLNAAQCARSEESPCLRALPEPGTRIPYDPTDRFVAGSSFYRYVGLSIPYGPYEAFYEVGDDLSMYYVDVSDSEPIEGPIDLAIDVQWGPWRAEDAIEVPPGLVVTEPIFDEDESIRVFSDDTAFLFEWEASDVGQLYLIVRDRNPSEDAWVYAIEDDGSFEFDISTLNLFGDRDLAFQLSRWSVDELDVNGNDLKVQSTADATFFVRYIDVQNREPIVPVLDTCESGFLERLPDGRYYGDLSNNSNDYEEAVCLQSFDAANGRDGVVFVDAPPRNELRINYRQLGSNAAMYLYEGCAPDQQVCVVGADLDPGQGEESLTLFNPSATEQADYVLVLDASEPLSGGLYFLDISRTPIPEPELADTCVELLQLPDIQAGTYYQGDMAGFFDEVDPGLTGCTGSAVSGPDGLIPVLVPDGVTLEVTLSMPGGNPALYLLGQCNNPNTCITGSDDPGSIETLIYTNTSGANQALTLAIDTVDPTASAFTLTVRMF